MRLLAALGMGRALRTLVPLGRRSVLYGAFFVSLSFPAGAAAWRDRFFVFPVAPGIICQRQGGVVGLVDSVVSGMIRRGISEAVAYMSLSCGGSL